MCLFILLASFLSANQEESSKVVLANICCILLSVEQVIAGFDRAVATMKKGERAILTLHPDFGFGSVEVRQDLAVVPPSSNIVFEVEMLDFIKVQTILMYLSIWGV